MPQIDVRVPRVNTNDDVVRLVGWEAAVGARVEAGATLAVVETAKAALEVPAPDAGHLRWRAEEGELAVGALLAVLTAAPDEPFALPGEEAVLAAGAARGATLKARLVARELGLAIEDVPPGPAGRVDEAAVRAFAGSRAGAASASGRAALLDLDPALPGATLIVGDGAHARYVHDVALRAGMNVLGCLSNRRAIGERVGPLSVLGRDEDLAFLRDQGLARALVGLGSSRAGARSNEARARLFERLVELGFLVPVLVDPDASVSASAHLDAGTLVGARAVVSAHARVGKNCLVNVGAIVCHDVVLEDHVHVTPGAILAGSVFVGAGSTIGMAATVLDGTRIGKNCLVPNNARVIRDLPDGTSAPAT